MIEVDFQQAACRGSDTGEFFPERGESAALAKETCSKCPIQEACLQYALDNREKFGIWGGTSERQRKKIRARTGRDFTVREDRLRQNLCTTSGEHPMIAENTFVDAAGRKNCRMCRNARNRKHRQSKPR